MEFTEVLFSAVGLIGTLLYVAGYLALQAGWLQADRAAYSCLNIVAAVLTLVSLTHSFNLASATGQVAWLLISVYGIARLRRGITSPSSASDIRGVERLLPLGRNVLSKGVAAVPTR